MVSNTTTNQNHHHGQNVAWALFEYDCDCDHGSEGGVDENDDDVATSDDSVLVIVVLIFFGRVLLASARSFRNFSCFVVAGVCNCVNLLCSSIV